MQLQNLVTVFANIIINPLLGLLFAVGVIIFLYGVAEFLFNFNVRGDGHAKEDGKRHMIWGLAGLFVMTSAFAIINIIIDTVNSAH